jgi:hypothetical protein
VRTVVLTSPSADARSRRALSRALERWPATVVDVPPLERGSHLQAYAAEPDVEWIVVVDSDAVLHPDAFGGLRRALTGVVAVAGGRAIVGGNQQRLGAMFGPSRSGPNPFDLVVLAGAEADRNFTALTRGRVDVPQRGVIVVAADFARGLANKMLDPVLLHVDLAVYARAAGRPVLCEPSLGFDIEEDSRELRARLADVRRYADLATWPPYELHREPPLLRSAFIQREVRIMGNYRGFARRPMPPIDVLAVAANELDVARVQRSAAALSGGGRISVCDPANGDALRNELSRTGERYLLVAEAGAFPDRALLETLIERIERNACTALALESLKPPFGAALLHCGRVVNGGAFGGSTVREVLADAAEALPRRRLNVIGVEPAPARVVPAAPGPRTLDVVFIGASRPDVTHQTFQAVLGEQVSGTRFAVYPAGAATMERVFSVHTGVQLVVDASDVQLAIGLNRALGACTADAIAIVRDDAQIPIGFFEHCLAAFGRIPRLGAVVPRVGGTDRPEALPEQSYLNSVEMQGTYNRRAEAYAREAMLVDVGTTPVIMFSREALEVAGGFDETFGFSRIGVEDFTRRLRSANFLVACCEDAYAHLFPIQESNSFVAILDDSPSLRFAYDQRWANRTDFDPQRDRVPVRTEAPPASAPGGLRVLLPIGSDTEWRRALPLLTELVQAFRAHDALEIAIGLDGTFQLQNVLTLMRDLLIASRIPMEETLNVSIDFVPDLAVWRDAATERRNVRLGAFERESLVELPAVAGAREIRALLEEMKA